MSTLYRIQIVLLTKFIFKFNSKLENKFVTKLINEANKDRGLEVRREVFNKMLVEVVDPIKHSKLAEARIVYSILRTRGLTRFMLMVFSKLIEIESGSEINVSRKQLLRILFRKKHLIREQLLSRLLFTRMNYADSLQYKHLTSIDYFRQSKMRINKTRKLFSFEVTFSSRQIWLKNSHSGRFYRNNVLDYVIIFERDFFFNIVHRYEIYNEVKMHLDKFYPSISNELNSFSKLSLQVNARASNNLDQLSASSNQQVIESLENVEIWHQRFIIKDSTWIVIDITTHPSLEFVAGQWQFLNPFKSKENACLIRNPIGKKRTLKSAILLMGRCDENWYHFIIDTVPRLLLTENVPPDVPLVIRNDIPEHFKFVISTLSKRSVIEIDVEDRVEIERLYIVPGRSSAFDSRPPKGVSFVEFSPSVLRRMQVLLRDSLIDISQYPNQPWSTEKIALSRTSMARNVQNWVSLIPILESFDFKLHDVNSDFFKSQMKTFHNTRIILSPGGASLANIIFMQEGALVVVLRSSRNRDVNVWTKLAAAMNVRCIEIIGIPTYFGPGKLRRRHSDFYVSPRKLRRVLISVTASITR